MTPPPSRTRPAARHAHRTAPPRPRLRFAVAAVAATLAVTTLTSFAYAPPPSAVAAVPEPQHVTVAAGTAPTQIVRDPFTVSAGYAEIAAGHTNYDWAELVLMYGDFPVTDTNVTVLVRWMRQENGTDDWWNRNNPLNNGWGSGGGSGLGSYVDLFSAAENAAKALHGNPGYAAIVSGLMSSAPTGTIEQAIWASPWATSHYADGAHWSQAVVPTVVSPEGTW